MKTGLGAAPLFLGLLAPASAFATTYNYIPSSIALSNANAGSSGQVCVLGTSIQLGSVPSYYLTKGSAGQGTWAPVVGATTVMSVNALTLGTDLTSLAVSPAASPYINSGAIRFFLVPASTACSSITYTYANAANAAAGTITAVYYPYPTGLLEISAYALANLPNAGDTSNVLTIDTSNVDNFQVPLSMTFTSPGASGTTTWGTMGNPVSATSQIITRKTMISGSAGGGGANSPFVTWLTNQPGYVASAKTGPAPYANLALSSTGWPSTAGTYPFAMIQSPTDYLAAQCQQPPVGQVPAGCAASGPILHLHDHLRSIYDTELATFFTNAKGKGTGKNNTALVLMGDGTASIPQQSWTAESNTADCPVFLKPDHKSLSLTGTLSTSVHIVICNPAGQIEKVTGGSVTYSQETGTAGKVTTAQIVMSATQHAMYKDKVGWNFGQPQTNWIGRVTKFVQQKGTTNYVMMLDVVQGPSGPITQALCTGTNCPRANTTDSTWVFTNVVDGTSTKPFETGSQMVFGNDGAFAAWLYYPPGDKLTVALSIERNIAWAFSHGVANCNNVTMNDKAIQPTYCASVASGLGQLRTSGGLDDLLSLLRLVNKSKATASDVYWMNEANWYPASGPQNYYAQYLHTAQLSNTGTMVIGKTCPNTCTNIFAVPNNSIGTATPSNQGLNMGMVYGFAYDENPDYLPGTASQVSSKLDPIPTGWGSSVAITVMVGH